MNDGADAAGAESQHRLRTIASFAIIYVFWGSNFLATRLGVRDLPPLLFSAARSYLASILLLGVAIAMKDRFPRTAREWGYMVLLSLLMITISNGSSTTAIKHIPSNEAALLTASLALWMAALGTHRPERPRRCRRAASSACCSGSAASRCWCGRGTARRRVISPGSCWCSRAASRGPSGRSCTATPPGDRADRVQCRDHVLRRDRCSFAGGVALGRAAAMALGPGAACWRCCILAVFGSAVSYTAFTWLMKNARTDRVATFAYVNPAIATVLGWVVLDERLGGLQIAGTLVILLSVALVTLPAERRRCWFERSATTPA